jgi:2-(1,2-epoxy-1,2-dihydrophenyl)acetyl-CoA isomerase
MVECRPYEGRRRSGARGRVTLDHEQIRFERAQGIARITLNRPERLNSFTTQMHEELRDALRSVADDASVRVLLLTGAGRGFCAGQDLADRAVAPGEAPVDLGASIDYNYRPLVVALRDLRVPVVCAVNGVAAGAGANIALACDLVVATRSASFIQAFCRIGLIPDAGGTYFLPRLVGLARAKALAMLGEKLTAEQAEAWGLIWKCVDDDVFAATVDALLTQLASAPTGGLAAIKRALHASADYSLDEQLTLERDAQRELGQSDDYREGVAAFLAKRAPKFAGR